MALTDFEKSKIDELKALGYSSREISKMLWGTKTRKSTVNDYLKSSGKNIKPDGPVIFFGDVECSPSIVMAFRRFKENISPNQVIQEPYLLTFAGQFLGDDKIISDKLTNYDEFNHDITDDFKLVKHLWYILDRTDIFVAHNAGFDTGWFNQRCAYWDLPPPSPYKVVCTLQTLRKEFSLPANSLDAATRYFNITRKLDNEGFSLWKRCVEGDRKAFDEMETYNRGDIPTLVELYNKIKPFMKRHPNMGAYTDEMCCSRCGSINLTKSDNSAYTDLSKFDLYQCDDCGSWSRGRSNKRTKDEMRSTLTKVS